MAELLNTTEKDALIKFKDAIKDVCKADHDDHMLLKWLKARSFSVPKAEAMYRKSMSWRAEIGADTILETFKVPELMTKYYPGGLCGRDKEGRPIWIDPFGGGDLRGIMSSVKKTDILKTMVYHMEELYAIFKKYTAEAGRPINQCSHIIDMEGVGANFMWKPALNLYIEIIQLLENNYPETLKVTYIINAPAVFRIGYNVIKTFMDKETANKFKFLDSKWQKSMADVFDMSSLPEHYGGSVRDPDGDPKCRSKICYGGNVPIDCYRKKDDFFPSTPSQTTLGRGSSATLAYLLPGNSYSVRYIFSVNSTDIEMAVYFDENGDSSSMSPKGLESVDVSRMEVFQPVHKYECQRVPEDGMIFFSKPGICYLQFKNPSRLFRRTLSYVVEVDHVDEQNQIEQISDYKSATLILEEDTL